MSSVSSVYSSKVAKLLHQAKFDVSCARKAQYPDDSGREVAFAGRSNVGKSSAINVITQQKKLAFSSKTPGRTQLINYFKLDEERRLVDLPGYGYAKVSAQAQAAWEKNLNDYFDVRQSLVGIVWLLDIRHDMSRHDKVMLEWLRYYSIPTHVLLTKCDKLSRSQAKSALFQFKKKLVAQGEFDLQVQIFSALKKEGLDLFFSRISDWYQMG